MGLSGNRALVGNPAGRGCEVPSIVSSMLSASRPVLYCQYLCVGFSRLVLVLYSTFQPVISCGSISYSGKPFMLVRGDL